MLKAQMRVIDRRRSASRVIERMESGVTQIYTKAAMFAVKKIVEYSPVDTGTYMDSHNVRVGRDRGQAINSSHNKPRKQSYRTHASQAKARMISQIKELGGSRDFVISNDAVHARYVEYGSAKNEARYVYLRAREATADHIKRLVQEFTL